MRKATLKKAILKKAIIVGLAIGFISLTQANESKAAVKEVSCKTETTKWPVYNKRRFVRKNIKYKDRYFITDGATRTVKIKLKTKQKKNLKYSTNEAKTSFKNGILTVKLKSGIEGCTVDIIDRPTMRLYERITIGYPEAYVQSELSKAPKYNTFAEYPYKQNYDQVTNDPLYTYELEKWWATMPQYIKDTLSYTKTKIKFTTSAAINGLAGTARHSGSSFKSKAGKPISVIKLLNSENKVNDLNYNTLLHEAAHIYYQFLDSKRCFELKESIAEEYKADKQRYGSYGATKQIEFHAEKVMYTNMIENNYYDDENLWNLILSRPQYYQYTSTYYNTTHIACVGWIGASEYGKGKDNRIDNCKTSDDYYTMYKSKIQEKFKAKGIPVEYVEIFDTKEEMEKWILPINPGVQLQQVTIQ